MMKWALRQAILWHRYLGICFCIFFTVWFASGIVMMYASWPLLTDAERLSRLGTVDPASIKLTPAEAFHRTGWKENPADARVGMIGARPVYRFRPAGGGKWMTVYADTGDILRELDQSTLVAIARQYEPSRPNNLQMVRRLSSIDQWTVYPGWEAHLPLQLVAADGRDATRYYISEATGELYQKTTRTQRFWAWLGAIPHWWYIRALRQNTPLWRAVMIGASGWGIITCVAGIFAGIVRFSPNKRYRFPGNRRASIPYVRWKRWHYIFAAIFAVPTFTWIVSGLFTMNPGRWSPGPDPTESELRSFSGAELSLGSFTISPQAALAAFERCLQPVELKLIVFHGQPYYIGTDRNAHTQLISATGDDNSCKSEMTVQPLLEAAARTVGAAPLREATVLNNYDAYYYDRTGAKPLPVIRTRFADDASTWLYINPRTVSIQARYNERSRLERWLYYGLHDLDFPFLYWRRPAWDITVIVLSAGGIVVSVTSIILALDYLRRSARRRRAKRIVHATN